MDLIQGLLFITPVFLLAIASPTPDMVLVSQQTLSKGEKAGFFCTLGILLGIALHIAFAAAGLSLVLIHSPTILWLVKLIGGSLLIVFGLLVLKTKSAVDLDRKLAGVRNQSNLKSFVVGLLGNLFNPLAPLFFLSLFTMVLSSDTPVYYIVVYGVWMLILDFFRFVLIIRLLSIPQIYNKLLQWGYWVDRFLAMTLIVFGLILIVRQVG